MTADSSLYRPDSKLLLANPEGKLVLPLDSLSVVDQDNPNPVVLRGVFTILHHPAITHRFANLPHDLARMHEIATTPKIHIITAQDPETGMTIATASITDSHAPEHEPWIGHVGVHPDYQGRGVGRQLFEYTLYHAFTNPDSEGVWREKLYMGVTLNEGHSSILALARKMGFSSVWQLQNQIGEQSSYENWAELVADWQDEMQHRDRTERHMITMETWAMKAARGHYPNLSVWGLTDQVRQDLAEAGVSIAANANGNGH